jgi:gamma-glutamyltranspeptidase/glutathione hydrolase/leukotriene-C4 hydrolase
MPVAKLAQGWQVSRSLAGRLRMFGYVGSYLQDRELTNSQFMLDEPIWKEIYAPRGYLAVEGEWIKRTAYGKTLEKVAKHGADAFYHGEIAKSMIKKLDSEGGVMTLKDVSPLKLLALRVEWIS